VNHSLHLLRLERWFIVCDPELVACLCPRAQSVYFNFPYSSIYANHSLGSGATFVYALFVRHLHDRSYNLKITINDYTEVLLATFWILTGRYKLMMLLPHVVVVKMDT